MALFVGGVPHLQHVLDHRGAADPGAGADAGARRQPAAGHRLGAARGGGRSACSPRCSASVAGIGVGARAAGAVRRVRRRSCRRRPRSSPPPHRDQRRSRSASLVTAAAALHAGPAGGRVPPIAALRDAATAGPARCAKQTIGRRRVVARRSARSALALGLTGSGGISRGSASAACCALHRRRRCCRRWSPGRWPALLGRLFSASAAGPPGPAERRAQPAPHRDHGRRADDRPRPGQRRHGPRLVAEGERREDRLGRDHAPTSSSTRRRSGMAGRPRSRPPQDGAGGAGMVDGMRVRTATMDGSEEFATVAGRRPRATVTWSTRRPGSGRPRPRHHRHLRRRRERRQARRSGRRCRCSSPVRGQATAAVAGDLPDQPADRRLPRATPRRRSTSPPSARRGAGQAAPGRRRRGRPQARWTRARGSTRTSRSLDQSEFVGQRPGRSTRWCTIIQILLAPAVLIACSA